jgi:integrase
MARKAKVWFRKQTGWYMTTIDGEQVKLSKDKKEAETAFHELLAGQTREDGEGPRPSLKVIAGQYLDEAKATKEPATYELQRHYLTSFCEHVGNKKVPDLRVHHVTAWLKANPQWGDSTQGLAVSLVTACMNWAAGEQRVAKNPLKGVRRKKTKRRERIIPPEHLRLILTQGPQRVAGFLTVLSQTGMRPFSELAKLTAAMIDWQSGTVTFEKHKNAKKGKRRVVFFTPETLELLRKQAEKHPEGLLFRTRWGTPWNRTSCRSELVRACDELGLPRYSTYDLRRSYITQGLANGLTANVMAQLCGNTPEVINRYYDSLHLKQDTLREAARRVNGGGAGTPPRPDHLEVPPSGSP